jgi:hypothetical protein
MLLTKRNDSGDGILKVQRLQHGNISGLSGGIGQERSRDRFKSRGPSLSR